MIKRLAISAIAIMAAATAFGHGHGDCCRPDFCPAAACPDSVAALPRPVTGIYNLELGGTFVTATYLSPLRYSGSAFTLSGSWTKAFNRHPERMTMRFDAAVDVDFTDNPSGNANILGFDARFGWGLGAQWRPAPRWRAGVGGGVDVLAGLLYSTRNGNNPVQVVARTGLAANAFCAYTFCIGRLPVVVEDEVTLPLLSGFFCQEYGESYYEIYLGNHKGLAHFGYPGNALAIDNLLSFKLDFGRTAMQIGYRLDIDTFHANQLKTQTLRNAIVIGVIPGGLGLKQKKTENRYY